MRPGYPTLSDTRIMLISFLVFLLFSVSYSGRPRNYLSDDVYFRLLEPPDVAYVYRSIPARDFGIQLTQTYRHISLVPTDPPESCSTLTNGDDISGSIALITRGGCSFLSKTVVAQNHGAVAALITDSNSENSKGIDMIHDYTERGVDIPALFLVGTDGHGIRRALSERGMKAAVISIPVNVTVQPDLLLHQTPWTLH